MDTWEDFKCEEIEIWIMECFVFIVSDESTSTEADWSLHTIFSFLFIYDDDNKKTEINSE